MHQGPIGPRMRLLNTPFGRDGRKGIPRSLSVGLRRPVDLDSIASRATDTLGPVTLATVAFWHRDEGWGAIEDPGRPGLGFVHFSFIRDMPGYRELTAGQVVEYEWGGEYLHDGCDWRPAWVRSTGRSEKT